MILDLFASAAIAANVVLNIILIGLLAITFFSLRTTVKQLIRTKDKTLSEDLVFLTALFAILVIALRS